jgi:hypothetical protein
MAKKQLSDSKRAALTKATAVRLGKKRAAPDAIQNIAKRPATQGSTQTVEGESSRQYIEDDDAEIEDDVEDVL